MPGHNTHAVVTLTLNSTAYNLGTLVNAARAAIPADLSVVRLSVQALSANSGVIFIGGDDTTSSSSYGERIEAPVSTVPAAPTLLFGDRSGPTPNLSDWYVRAASAGDKLAVMIQRNDA